MWDTDHCGFGNLRMRHQRRFDFSCSQTVAGDVQHIVHTSGDPVIAIFVTARAVAAEVHILEGREVGLLKAFVIAKQRSRLARPRVGNHQIAFGRAFQRITFVIDNRRLYAKEWTGCRTGFQFGGARQRGDHESTGFSLPPGIDDRAFFVADLLPVPLPCFRVDRLANGTQDTQRRTVSTFNRFIAFRHQGANGGRCGIQNIDLMLVHNLRHTRRGRPVWHAFEHQRGCAAGQRTVQQVAVPGYPAYVSGTPIDIALMVIKHILKGGCSVDQIPAGSVQHAFRLTG